MYCGSMVSAWRGSVAEWRVLNVALGRGSGNAAVSREPDVFARWLDGGLSRSRRCHLVR